MEGKEISLLVVDDDRSNLESLKKIFSKEGFRVLSALSGKEALDLIRQHVVDVLLTDLVMPSMNGVELLKAALGRKPDLQVVLMTAYGTVDTAVNAMKEGAYDFVEKPLKRMSIVKTVRKAAEKSQLVAENRDLREKLANYENRTIIGTSAVLRHALDVAVTAAA